MSCYTGPARGQLRWLDSPEVACVARPVLVGRRRGKPNTHQHAFLATVRDDVDAIDAQIEREHDADEHAHD